MHRSTSTIAAALLFLSTFTTALTIQSRDSCQSVTNVIHTFYGYPDNDPAGAATAYDCGRNYIAGGTGTYSDPLTFASAQGEFEECEIIYDPYLKKYLRYEDMCAQCTTEWEEGQQWHIDVWMGSNTENGGDDLVQCEYTMTPDPQGIVRNPSANLEVDGKSL
jgi:hypothetical protein